MVGPFQGHGAGEYQVGFLNSLEYNLAKDGYTLTPYSQFLSLALTVRDRLIERWIISKQQYHDTTSSGDIICQWNSSWAG